MTPAQNYGGEEALHPVGAHQRGDHHCHRARNGRDHGRTLAGEGDDHGNGEGSKDAHARIHSSDHGESGSLENQRQ
ncbi:MAG: hypothetical protein ACTIJ0_00915 [Glutamicibacter ardleyensis]